MRSGLQVAAASSTHFRSLLLRILPAASDTGDSCTCIFAMYCVSNLADKDHFYHTERALFHKSASIWSVELTTDYTDYTDDYNSASMEQDLRQLRDIIRQR